MSAVDYFIIDVQFTQKAARLSEKLAFTLPILFDTHNISTAKINNKEDRGQPSLIPHTFDVHLYNASKSCSSTEWD